jgi:hypothetical protein
MHVFFHIEVIKASLTMFFLADDWPAGENENKANSAHQLNLELGPGSVL